VSLGHATETGGPEQQLELGRHERRPAHPPRSGTGRRPADCPEADEARAKDHGAGDELTPGQWHRSSKHGRLDGCGSPDLTAREKDLGDERPDPVTHDHWGTPPRLSIRPDNPGEVVDQVREAADWWPFASQGVGAGVVDARLLAGPARGGRDPAVLSE
jgi:hypothetical protein